MVANNTIVIGGVTYRLKLGFCALALYEQVTGLQFSDCKGLMNTAKMLFCVLTAYNEETFKMDFDEFVKAADDIEVVTSFSMWLGAEWARQATLTGKAVESKEDGTKKKCRPSRWFSGSFSKAAWHGKR